MANLYVNSRLTIPEKQISMTMARSSGPGGQNVNKVNTKVTLRWALAQCKEFNAGWRQRFLARHGNRINRDGEFILHSEKYRDQVRNIADVRQKLVNMLMECQAAPKVRKPTNPHGLAIGVDWTKNDNNPRKKRAVRESGAVNEMPVSNGIDVDASRRKTRWYTLN